MTAVRETVDLRAEHEASHNVDGECWLCAVGPAWWGELRQKRGYDAPPFARPERPMQFIEVEIPVIPAGGRVEWRCLPGRRNHSWYVLNRWEKKCGFCNRVQNF